MSWAKRTVTLVDMWYEHVSCLTFIGFMLPWWNQSALSAPFFGDCRQLGGIRLTPSWVRFFQKRETKNTQSKGTLSFIKDLYIVSLSSELCWETGKRRQDKANTMILRTDWWAWCFSINYFIYVYPKCCFLQVPLHRLSPHPWLRPNKTVPCYICAWGLRPIPLYSLVGSSVSGSSQKFSLVDTVGLPVWLASP